MLANLFDKFDRINYLLYYQYRGNISSRFSSNSEALEEIFPLYYIFSDMFSMIFNHTFLECMYMFIDSLDN